MHEDTLGFHGFTLESEVFCRVNDGTILLNFKKYEISKYNEEKYDQNNLSNKLTA